MLQCTYSDRSTIDSTSHSSLRADTDTLHFRTQSGFSSLPEGCEAYLPMTGATAKMLLGGRATLHPVAAARTLHSRNALLPGLSSLRAATLAPDSPPKWGFMSASRSTVMDQVQR